MWSGATLTCEIWQLIMHIASSFYASDPFERRILAHTVSYIAHYIARIMNSFCTKR